MRVGDAIPGFKFGKCTFEVEVGKTCGTPAAIHFWSEAGGSPWTGFVCEGHLPAADCIEDVRDAHPVDAGCVDPHAAWVLSTVDRNGWCEPEGQTAAELLNEEAMSG